MNKVVLEWSASKKSDAVEALVALVGLSKLRDPRQPFAHFRCLINQSCYVKMNHTMFQVCADLYKTKSPVSVRWPSFTYFFLFCF